MMDTKPTAVMTSARADEDQFCDLPTGVRLCFRTHGPADGVPLVLIAGLGLQLTYWSPLLIMGLVERGFRVAVLDNRDVGRSSRMQGRPPGLWRLFTRRADPSSYDIGDMADDVLGLMQHLGMPKAHVVGMSMGGMIAQTLAARQPARVLSLTSIFSTTGAGKVGQPAFSTMLRIAKAPPATRDEAIERYLSMMQHVGSTRYAMDEQALRAYAAQAWDRGDGKAGARGVGRQIGAIMKSGDRTAQLRAIKAPTLVLHGERDLLVAASGGQATADAIPGATLVTLPGMGHFIPAGIVPWLLDLINGHAQRSLAQQAPALAAHNKAASAWHTDDAASAAIERARRA